MTTFLRHKIDIFGVPQKHRFQGVPPKMVHPCCTKCTKCTSCFTVPANRNLSRAGAGARARTRARTRARVRAKVHVRACMCNSCNSCFTLRVKHGNPRLRPFNCWWVPARSSMRLPTLLKHYRASSELLARNAPWVVYIVARKNCAPTNSF